MMDEKSLIATIDAFLSGDISAKASEDNALGERINRLFDLVADETAMIQKREAEFQKAFIHIRRVVTKLMQGDLFETRIDTGLLPAGLMPVGQAFNALLDKIQELLQAQKRAIGELDSAKASIEQERAYWQELFESSQSGMAVFDLQGGVWEVNETVTKMFGYTKEEIQDPDFSWANIIAPEDLSMAMERLKDLLQTGEAQKFELTFVHKAGKKVPTLISYDRLTKRPEWQTDRMVASIQDIVEIKAQQDYVNDLLGLLPVGSFSFDVETAQIYSANPLLQDILGFTEEELRQKTPFDLLPEELHCTARERIQTALRANERGWVQYPLLAKDGSKIPALISYGKVYDPCIEKDIMAVFVVDVSESERIKAKMDLLLKLSPVGICEWRPGGELLEINDQYAAMVGYTKEEVFKMGWKNLTPPEYQGEPDRLHEENALKGIDKTYQKEYIHKDGHRVPIYLVTEPIFKQDGTPDYYISYIQDITEIKEAQAKLEELVEAQQRTIKEISTPIIPVWTRVIMAPLLGSFDSMRMHDLSERLLEEVASKKPRAVLLDLSGLALVDTQVVSEILRLVTSVRLLGARMILSGIGPVVAQSLVRLGANLEGIATYATLEQALRGVVGEVGRGK
jgi:PAS domain S-box-containing protein